MKKNIFVFSVLFFFFSANAKIQPDIVTPMGFDENKFSLKMIGEYSYFPYNTVENSGCSNVLYKDYPLDVHDGNINSPMVLSIKRLVCVFSNGVYEDGYDRKSMAERVVYSKSRELWIKIKQKKSKLSNGYKSIPYKEIELYNIESRNSRGFAVVNENITDSDRDSYKKQELKKVVSFCLIKGQDALCGSGDLIVKVEGKDVDLTSYILKSLESMEIGVDNPLNAN